MHSIFAILFSSNMICAILNNGQLPSDWNNSMEYIIMISFISHTWFQEQGYHSLQCCAEVKQIVVSTVKLR